MTRSELALILLDLVQRKAITPEEVVEVLRRFDAGELAEDDLPLPASTDARLVGQHNDWIAALALLLILLNINPGLTLNKIQSKRARKLLRSQFETETMRTGIQVASGAITIATWQRSMQASLSNYTRQMAVAGAGRIPSIATQTIVEERLATQWSYLQRFATQIMARQIGERAMSEPWIVQRARQYGGTGWGSFFAGQGSEAQPGYADVWLTRDDPAVCRVCAPRHQTFFAPGVGPYPGWDCLGDCRCVRQSEFAPDIYEALTRSTAVREARGSGDGSTEGLSKRIHPTNLRLAAERAREEARQQRSRARVLARERSRS